MSLINIGWAKLPREFETMSAEYQGAHWDYNFPKDHVIFGAGGAGWNVLAFGQPPPSALVVTVQRPPYPQAFHVRVIIVESGQPPQGLHLTYGTAGEFVGDDASALVGQTSPAEIVARVRPMTDPIAKDFAVAAHWTVAAEGGRP